MSFQYYANCCQSGCVIDLEPTTERGPYIRVCDVCETTQLLSRVFVLTLANQGVAAFCDLHNIVCTGAIFLFNKFFIFFSQDLNNYPASFILDLRFAGTATSILWQFFFIHSEYFYSLTISQFTYFQFYFGLLEQRHQLLLSVSHNQQQHFRILVNHTLFLSPFNNNLQTHRLI